MDTPDCENLLLAKGNADYPRTREEATESALVDDALHGTQDFGIVVAAGYRADIRKSFGVKRPNLVHGFTLSEKEVPAQLEGLDPNVWATFHHNLSQESIVAGSPVFYKALLGWVPMGLFLKWVLGVLQENSAVNHLSVLLLMMGALAMVAWPLHDYQKRLHRGVSKLVTKMSGALEREGFWITLVTSSGWTYIQFTPVPDDAQLLQTTKNQRRQRQKQHELYQQQAYRPEHWIALEGTWKRTAESPSILARESWITGKSTSETLVFQGMRNDNTVCFSGSSSLACCLFPMQTLELQGKAEGNSLKGTYNVGSGVDLQVFPILGTSALTSSNGRACSYYDIEASTKCLGLRQVCQVEGDKMEVFTFHYLDCPPDDDILESSLSMEEFQFWEVYERVQS